MQRVEKPGDFARLCLCCMLGAGYWGKRRGEVGTVVSSSAFLSSCAGRGGQTEVDIFRELVGWLIWIIRKIMLFGV